MTPRTIGTEITEAGILSLVSFLSGVGGILPLRMRTDQCGAFILTMSTPSTSATIPPCLYGQILMNTTSGSLLKPSTCYPNQHQGANKGDFFMDVFVGYSLVLCMIALVWSLKK